MKLIKKIGGFATALLMLLSVHSGVSFSKAEQKSYKLYINEVCTQNKKSFTDSLNRASDWIELYNSDNNDLDLSGFGLSDNPDNPMKFVFPSGTVIKKGQYLIIVSDKNGIGMTELNTGFGLSKSGEILSLSSPDGTILQTLEIPALAEDTTFGRLSDGTYSVMTPTPSSANHPTPAEPVFSLESGFYSVNDVKQLSLTSAEKIYYTLDGSDPTTSATAKVYTDAIPMYDRSIDDNVYSKYQHEDYSPYSITLSQSYEANPEKFDKVTIVRAASKASDGSFSRVISKTYFIMDDEKLKYYSEIPVISIVTDPDNLFDKDKGIYVTGQKYMDYLENAENDEGILDDITNFSSSGKEWEREADISYFKNGNLGFTQKMGIRIRGASTRDSEAKSFNIYARSEYGDSKLDFKILDENRSVTDNKIIKRYDSFGLRSVTWIDRLRELTVNSSLKDLHALATYANDRCMLFIDGELWGMYEITEKASDYYIQTKYGVPSENVSIIKNGVLEEGPEDEPLNLQLLGDFCEENDLSSPENYAYVTSQVDVESIIDHYCTGLYLGIWDWPNYNYLIWRNNSDAIEGNPYSDGKWRFGSFDFDYSVGITYDSFGDVEPYQHDSFQKMDSVKEGIPTLIFTKLLENPEFKQQFADKFYSYAYSVFESSKMVAELDEEENRYIDYLTMTAWRWLDGPPDSELNDFLSEQKIYYHNEREEMRTFFKNRADYAVMNMQNYLGIPNDAATITVTKNGNGNISASSVSTKFSGNVWTGSFEKGEKITLTAKPDDGYTFAGWSGAITSDSETITVSAEKATALVCSFQKKESAKGDINMDGTISVADLLLLNKYLLKAGNISKKQFELADMNSDNSADIFDLVCLRKELLN